MRTWRLAGVQRLHGRRLTYRQRQMRSPQPLYLRSRQVTTRATRCMARGVWRCAVSGQLVGTSRKRSERKGMGRMQLSGKLERADLI
jgi:hypothetical protein